jgi:hypothetical protein
MRKKSARSIRITHRSSGEVIAEGPLGLWGITPFEGNFYISRKYRRWATCDRIGCQDSASINSFMFGLICGCPTARGSPLSDVLAAKPTAAVHSISAGGASLVACSADRRAYRLKRTRIEALCGGYQPTRCNADLPERQLGLEA